MVTIPSKHQFQIYATAPDGNVVIHDCGVKASARVIAKSLRDVGFHNVKLVDRKKGTITDY